MQRIDAVHEVNDLTASADHYMEYEQAAEEDFITDEQEIKAVIRRAITLSWQDTVFTLSELHSHLIKNFVKFPVPDNELNEWLESTVYDIWRVQKEIARAAGVPLPTIVNAGIDGRQHYGVVTPGIAEEMEYAEPQLLVIPATDAVAEPVQLVVVEELEVQQQTIEQVADLEIHRPLRTLRPSEVATRLFDAYIASSDMSPQFDTSHLMKLFNDPDYAVQAKDVRGVIKDMAENGYIESYTTGKNKKQRTWWRMNGDVKQEILADIADGSFYESLPSMFDNQEAVA